MDFTVEYRGWLKEDAEDELERRLRNAVARNEWGIRWRDFDEFPMMRQEDDAYSLYCGPAAGWSIDFHPDCEPVRLYMEPNRYLENFIRIRHCPVKTHVAIVDMFREVQDLFDDFAINDEGHYWETGSTAFLDHRKAFEDECMRRAEERFTDVQDVDGTEEDEETLEPSSDDGMPRIGYGFEYADLDWDDEDFRACDEDEDDPDDLPF